MLHKEFIAAEDQIFKKFKCTSYTQNLKLKINVKKIVSFVVKSLAKN